jgi:hypothetical protein
MNETNAMTINEALVLVKIVRERMSDLKQLRSQLSVKERFFLRGSDEKITEPQYDVKTVDQKITTLQNFLYRVDARIKQSNATNKIQIDTNVEALLEPLK